MLYKSYALYKEEKIFNVIQGQVPEFKKNTSDVIIAALIDGEFTNKIPLKEEPYVFESIECSHGAEASWNNDTWSLSINNLTISGTTCTLHFARYGFEELVASIKSNATNVQELMSNATDIDNIVKTEEAMKIIAEQENLRKAIQSNEKYTTEVAKKFLNSTVITEEEKYNGGLPCYLFKDGKDLVGGFSMQRTTDNATGAALNGNDYHMYASFAGNYVTISSNNKITTQNYSILEIYSTHSTNLERLTGTTTLGIASDQSISSFLVSNSETFAYTSASSTLKTNISSYTAPSYLKVKVLHNGTSNTMFTVTVNISTLAVY